MPSHPSAKTSRHDSRLPIQIFIERKEQNNAQPNPLDPRLRMPEPQPQHQQNEREYPSFASRYFRGTVVSHLRGRKIIRDRLLVHEWRIILPMVMATPIPASTQARHSGIRLAQLRRITVAKREIDAAISSPVQNEILTICLIRPPGETLRDTNYKCLLLVFLCPFTQNYRSTFPPQSSTIKRGDPELNCVIGRIHYSIRTTVQVSVNDRGSSPFPGG